MAFEPALQHCLSIDVNTTFMLVLHDAAESTAARNVAQGLVDNGTIPQNFNFYIGVNESQLAWETGQALGFRDWCGGSPSQPPDSGYRVVLKGSGGFCWDFVDASEVHGYVCEIPGECPAPDPLFEELQGRWYYRSAATYFYYEAPPVCDVYPGAQRIIWYQRQDKDVVRTPPYKGKVNYIGMKTPGPTLAANCTGPSECEGKAEWDDDYPLRNESWIHWTTALTSNAVVYRGMNNRIQGWTAAEPDSSLKFWVICQSKCETKRCPWPPNLENGDRDWPWEYRFFRDNTIR